MSKKTVNVELTEEELEEIKSGTVSPTLRKKLGADVNTIKITAVYEFSFGASDPIYMPLSGGFDYNEEEIRSLEDLDKFFDKEKDWVNAVDEIMGNNDPTSIIVTYGDKIVKMEVVRY